ncbi:MAG: Crp/Fnr family transcriptional regulator [Myxococcales bacterium]|nr:Crp/Fnr family transcriptional regulator [Myxococcales bacterium]
MGDLRTADLAWWRATLTRQAPLAEADLAAVTPHLRVKTLAAGEAYLRSGAPAVAVGLIRAGLVRETFLVADGRERVRAFGIAGDFAGSLSDLLRGGAARCEVIACAPTRVLTVPWAVIARAAAARPAWRGLVAAVTERLYLLKAEREYELLALDAHDRYQRFRARLAAIEPLVPQRHVASYLGITPEHLSRLRRRLGLPRARPVAASRSPRRTRS